MLAPKSDYIKRELIPAGTYLARLYSIIEIGTETFEYQGEEKKSHKIRLTWELPTELKVFNEEKGEQPIVISEEMGFSMHEKATLRSKIVHGMLGTSLTDTEAEGFDIDNLLGKECLLNIVHKPSKKDSEVKYEQINSVSPLMKGQTCPEQINPNVTLYFSNWSQELFEKLPEFLRKKIMATPEYQSTIGVGGDSSSVSNKVTEEAINPEDIPFN